MQAAFVFGLFLLWFGIYTSVADKKFEAPEHYADPGNMFTFDHQENVNRKTDDLEIGWLEKVTKVLEEALKVIQVTLTRFDFEPMEHVGTTFKELPVQFWILAFIFVIVVIIILLLVSVLQQQRETIKRLEEDLKKQKALPASQTDVETTAPKTILPPATLRRRNTTPPSYSQGQGDGEYISVSPQSSANHEDQRPVPLPRSKTIEFERIVEESNAESHTTRLQIPVHPEGETSELTSVSSSTEPKHLSTQGVNENQQQSETFQNNAGSVLGSYHSEVESLPTIADDTVAAGENWENVSSDARNRENNQNMRFEQEAAGGIATVSDP